MLNWTIGRAYLPSVCSLSSDRTIFRSTISKRLLLIRLLPPSVFFHTTPGVGWHCWQGPVPHCPFPGCADRQRSHTRVGRSGALGHTMLRRSSVCLQAVPCHVPTGHTSFSPCCWAETALPQQCGHSPFPPKMCP